VSLGQPGEPILRVTAQADTLYVYALPAAPKTSSSAAVGDADVAQAAA
jgi:hypothetical protein